MATYYYDSSLADAAPMEYKPDFLETDETTDPMGSGDTFGQEYGVLKWSIYSYNDDASDEDWDTGSYHFYYVEGTHSTGYYTGFTQDITLDISSGAAQLVAASATATLLLALM